MTNSELNIKVSFRFLNLDKFQAYTLQREIMGASFQKHAELDCYVGLIPLSEDTLEDINNYHVKQRVKITCCDILMAIVTELDNVEVEAPEIVNKMLKYLDCKVTFSYTRKPEDL